LPITPRANFSSDVDEQVDNAKGDPTAAQNNLKLNAPAEMVDNCLD
jgi:hypothetical protein